MEAVRGALEGADVPAMPTMPVPPLRIVPEAAALIAKRYSMEGVSPPSGVSVRVVMWVRPETAFSL